MMLAVPSSAPLAPYNGFIQVKYELFIWVQLKLNKRSKQFDKKRLTGGGPIPRLGVTPGGQNLYHWIPGVGVPISVP